MGNQRVVKNQLYSRIQSRNWSNATNSWGAWNTALTLNSVGDVTITHGDNIPSYKMKIRLKESATTTLVADGHKMSQELPFGQLRIRREYIPTKAVTVRSETGGHLGAFINPPGLPTLANTRADNQALAHFVKKAANAQRTLSGGVVLGEIREVVRLIRRPVILLRRGLVDHIHNVEKRLRQRRGIRSLKSRKSRLHAVNRVISSSWLEYQFGWKPLISDIEDGLIAAYQLANEDRPSKVVSAFSTESTLGARSTDIRSVGLGQLTSTFVERDEVTVRYKGCVLIDSGLTGASRRLGLSWSDLAPTIWELIPYSFLVDYFSNIGDIIEALAFNRASIVWMERGQYSRRVKEHISTTYTVATPPTQYRHTVEEFSAPGKFEIERFNKSRANYTGSVVPSLEFQVPGTKSLKWLNIAALVSQGRSSQRRLQADLRL